MEKLAKNQELISRHVCNDGKFVAGILIFHIDLVLLIVTFTISNEMVEYFRVFVFTFAQHSKA